MTHGHRNVVVFEFPESLTPEKERLFRKEIAPALHKPRPRLVLDCSRLRALDARTLHLLLFTLEEAMKANGDVRLAAIPGNLAKAWQKSGAERLFAAYPTVPEAVKSFHAPAIARFIEPEVPELTLALSENLA